MSGKGNLDELPTQPALRVGADLLSAVRARVARRPILNNRYFESLRDGSMDLAGFQRSQLQFLFAVRFFPRTMAALAARLPDSNGRMALMHNLAEEHGEFCGDRAHDSTFKQFLASLGVSPREIAATQECAAVRAFNLALLGTCAMAEAELAFASLGVIEYTFADISAHIGQVVVERGWVSRQNLVHYTLHSELDQRHAADLFAQIETPWAQDVSKREHIEAGLALGLYLFDRLYTDLERLVYE